MGIKQRKTFRRAKQELVSELESLYELLNQLESEKVFTFVLENGGKIFNGINPKIKSLSEENFYHFLLFVFEKIREKNLASKENLENGKIGKVVTKCVHDIRGTEAKDSLIKLGGWPLGIKVDPKNFSGSLKDGLLGKVPFLSKKEKEEERPLSDKEMVTKFLGKIFLPIFFSIVSILVFAPNAITIVVAVVGGIFAVKGGIEVLFSNNTPGTLYNPNSKEEEGKDWDNEIIDRIRNILKTPIKGTGKSEQPRENFKKTEKLYLPSGKIEEVIKAVKGLQSGDIKSSSLSDMSCIINIKQVLSR